MEFSGLEDFIEEPVKNYSSGMYVRLGFSVAIHTDPDILLVDEVLAVGDEAFTHRCLRRIEEFLSQGKTLLLVSHSLGLIEEYADQVLWLDNGSQRLLGSPRRVADAYRHAVAEEEARGHQEAKDKRQKALEARAHEEPREASRDPETVAEPLPEPSTEPADETHQLEEEPLRWGSGEAEIVGVRLVDGRGEERYHLTSGEEVSFVIDVKARRPLTDFVFGVGVFTPRRVECWGTNTDLAGFAPARFEGQTTVRLHCPCLRLAPGEYLLDVAVHARGGHSYDYQRRYLSFTVTSSVGGVGIYYPEHRWSFDEAVRWKKKPPAGG